MPIMPTFLEVGASAVLGCAALIAAFVQLGWADVAFLDLNAGPSLATHGHPTMKAARLHNSFDAPMAVESFTSMMIRVTHEQFNQIVTPHA